jgi:dihydroneopterin aldolase
VSDSIIIEKLRVECVVGVLPRERHAEQPLEADVELELDLARAARSGRIVETADYDRVAHELAALLQFRRYRLLETAAEEAAAMLLAAHPAVRRVGLSLTKPQALEGRAHAARVTVRRSLHDYPRRREDAVFGGVEVLYEGHEAGLYLLHVAPGREIPPHRHAVMRELEWLVGGELLRNGAPADPTPATWELGMVHGYRNRSAREAVLFCCDTPPFVREDEIVVPAAEVPW